MDLTSKQAPNGACEGYTWIWIVRKCRNWLKTGASYDEWQNDGDKFSAWVMQQTNPIDLIVSTWKLLSGAPGGIEYISDDKDGPYNDLTSKDLKTRGYSLINNAKAVSGRNLMASKWLSSEGLAVVGSDTGMNANYRKICIAALQYLNPQLLKSDLAQVIGLISFQGGGKGHAIGFSVVRKKRKKLPTAVCYINTYDPNVGELSYFVPSGELIDIMDAFQDIFSSITAQYDFTKKACFNYAQLVAPKG